MMTAIKKGKTFIDIVLCIAFIGILQSCGSNSGSTEDTTPSNDNSSIVIDDEAIAAAKPMPPMPSASINKVWTTQFYNTIEFHADFDVNNMLNKTGTFVVYVTKQFTHDKPIEVYWYDTFTPSYENSSYSDFKYTLKKEQITEDLRFNGETHFKAYIRIYDDRERLLGTSEYTSFTIEQYIPLFQ